MDEWQTRAGTICHTSYLLLDISPPVRLPYTANIPPPVVQ